MMEMFIYENVLFFSVTVDIAAHSQAGLPLGCALKVIDK